MSIPRQKFILQRQSLRTHRSYAFLSSRKLSTSGGYSSTLTTLRLLPSSAFPKSHSSSRTAQSSAVSITHKGRSSIYRSAHTSVFTLDSLLRILVYASHDDQSIGPSGRSSYIPHATCVRLVEDMIKLGRSYQVVQGRSRQSWSVSGKECLTGRRVPVEISCSVKQGRSLRRICRASS